MGLAATSTSSTASLAFGGGTSPKQQTEEWNGISWVEVGDLNDGRQGFAGAGTVTAGLAAGGNRTTGYTEEWSSTSNTDKTISTD